MYVEQRNPDGREWRHETGASQSRASLGRDHLARRCRARRRRGLGRRNPFEGRPHHQGPHERRPTAWPRCRTIEPDSHSKKQIVFVDEEKSRIFFSRRQIQAVRPDSGGGEEQFNVPQPSMKRVGKVAVVGQITKDQPFDEFGRKLVEMGTGKGPLKIVLAITEITPQYIKVEALNYKWEMQMATSTLPTQTLGAILHRQIAKLPAPRQIEGWKRIIRLYLQADRCEDAMRELLQLLKDYPNDTELAAALASTKRQLRQMMAERLLSELKLRRDGGQHELVEGFLDKFPSDDVAGKILQEVREIIQQYQTLRAHRTQVVKECNALVAEVQKQGKWQGLQRFAKELDKDLSIDALPRMVAYLQARGDSDVTAENKLALAMSGWLMGADSATRDLSRAASAYRVRGLAQRYLAAATKPERNRLYSELAAEEAASAKALADLLANMPPPFPLPEPLDEAMPGYYKLEVAALPGHAPAAYYLQLPPEYNPYRRYPMIVTLHGLTSNAEQQIDWWAGAWSNGKRLGQATRHGYIVLSPDWTVQHQHEYEFSAREHAVVLASHPRRLPPVRHRHRPRLPLRPLAWAATPPGTSGWPIRTCGRA